MQKYKQKAGIDKIGYIWHALRQINHGCSPDVVCRNGDTVRVQETDVGEGAAAAERHVVHMSDHLVLTNTIDVHNQLLILFNLQ